MELDAAAFFHRIGLIPKVKTTFGSGVRFTASDQSQKWRPLSGPMLASPHRTGPESGERFQVRCSLHRIGFIPKVETTFGSDAHFTASDQSRKWRPLSGPMLSFTASDQSRKWRPLSDPMLTSSHRIGPESGDHFRVRCSGRAVADQVVDDRRIGQSRGVAERGELILGDLAQDAPHDLAGARLRQSRREMDDVG